MDPRAWWRALQIADSAFPTGGFAHSSGLEAAVAFGEARTAAELDTFLIAHLWNVGHTALPFIGAAHDDPRAAARLDGHLDALLTNHVANRASRTQGRAFVATCERVFDATEIASLAAAVRDRTLVAHLAPLFGAVLSRLDVPRREAMGIYLHSALRSVVSAAVRLGVIGPVEGQRISASRAGLLEEILEACSAIDPADAACVAPVADILAGSHDRLYAKLFQS